MSSMPRIAVQHYFFGTTRSIFAGGGLCYAIQKENYIEIPLILVFPSAYAGYHLYKNKEAVSKYVKDLRKWWL
jgi:hypothetical protein